MRRLEMLVVLCPGQVNLAWSRVRDPLGRGSDTARCKALSLRLHAPPAAPAGPPASRRQRAHEHDGGDLRNRFEGPILLAQTVMLAGVGQGYLASGRHDVSPMTLRLREMHMRRDVLSVSVCRSLPRCARSTRRLQRGSIYLDYALIALALAIVGLLLLPVHKAFGLLVPAAIVVFFIPNLAALGASMTMSWRFTRAWSAVRNGRLPPAVMLRNEFFGINAQALWFDPATYRLGVVSATDGDLSQPLDRLERVRVSFLEESHARSFHQGDVRIPARYLLAFEFTGGQVLGIVTRRRRSVDRWIEALHPHVGALLDLTAISAAKRSDR